MMHISMLHFHNILVALAVMMMCAAVSPVQKILVGYRKSRSMYACCNVSTFFQNFCVFYYAFQVLSSTCVVTALEMYIVI